MAADGEPARRRPPTFDEQTAFFATEVHKGAYRCLGTALRGGVHRTVRCADAVSWLRAQGPLPCRYHVITSLPDIGELKPRLSPAEYETWFTDVVCMLLAKLDPHAVAIFYQTDGRASGVDGTYLDKSYLCHRGAHEAGAACLFHRIVCAGPLGLARGAHVRPSFAHMLCFSKAFRPRGGLQWSDVLPSRGHMSYAGAMGEHACSEAVAFIVSAHQRRPRRPPVAGEAADAVLHCEAIGKEACGEEAGSEEACSEEAISDDVLETMLPEAEADAPPLVFDPFVGHGSVLAMANAYGLDAFGIDINGSRCESSLGHQLRGGEVRADSRGTAPAKSAADPCRGPCACDGDHPNCRTS